MSPRRPNPKPIPYVARDGTKTWRIRYRLGTGPHAVNTSETFDTRADAATFAAHIFADGAEAAVAWLTARDTPATPEGGPTLDAVFEGFIAWNAGRVKSSRTGEEYRAQWASIGPAIGAHRPVREITDDDVQRWVDGMTSGTVGARIVNGKPIPLSPKTIANRHALLHGVFKFAAARGQRYITSNPCTETELPKRRKKLPKGLRPGEWAALHAALRQIDPDAADLCWALYASGARFGEMTAMQTWNVEDDGRHVTLVIDHVNRRLEGGRYEIVEDTKSEAGFRRVRLGVGASDMVRRRVLSADRGGLVFTNRRGRIWLHSTLYASWNKAVELANLSRRPTVHWLRHSHVQALLDRGEELQQIQRRVGHEHYGTTVGTYGSSQRGVRDDVLDVLDPLEEIDAGPVIAGEIVG